MKTLLELLRGKAYLLFQMGLVRKVPDHASGIINHERTRGWSFHVGRR